FYSIAQDKGVFYSIGVLYSTGTFYSIVQEYYIVQEYSIREEQREELALQLLLLAPLEWLLLGEEPAAGLALLQENNQPSPLCGHVFKVGEPTYSCRECAADPTCVLCMQCFLGSVHKEHRYRMTTSGGGGFCDCGDAEAWKNGPYCQKHTADGTRDTEEVRHLSVCLSVCLYLSVCLFLTCLSVCFSPVGLSVSPGPCLSAAS
uniref:E3 ubiquitin-protein ligase n=1 Tax=Amphiprion percula TaxID=161767 RepID=A0A3P8TB44_AMPPE